MHRPPNGVAALAESGRNLFALVADGAGGGASFLGLSSSGRREAPDESRLSSSAKSHPLQLVRGPQPALVPAQLLLDGAIASLQLLGQDVVGGHGVDSVVGGGGSGALVSSAAEHALQTPHVAAAAAAAAAGGRHAVLLPPRRLLSHPEPPQGRPAIESSTQ